MNIWYFSMNPNIPYGAPHFAPSIHIRETVQSLESLGHRVQPFIYGDNLTGLDKTLRKGKKQGEWKEESGSSNGPTP